MRYRLPVALLAILVAARASDPREAWERALQAKGGRARLHAVHSLAVYLKPSQVLLKGPPATWFCVFPDRYYEYGRTSAGARAIVVDAAANRVATDITGQPRATRPLGEAERERLVLNQILFLLDSAWLQPQPRDLRRNVLTVEAAGRDFRLYLNRAGLPERILAAPAPGEDSRNSYDFRLQHYRDFQGIQLPARLVWASSLFEWNWDADYELDAKYNPKFFDRSPDLADGPEPWRK